MVFTGSGLAVLHMTRSPMEVKAQPKFLSHSAVGFWVFSFATGGCLEGWKLGVLEGSLLLGSLFGVGVL